MEDRLASVAGVVPRGDITCRQLKKPFALELEGTAGPVAGIFRDPGCDIAGLENEEAPLVIGPFDILW